MQNTLLRFSQPSLTGFMNNQALKCHKTHFALRFIKILRAVNRWKGESDIGPRYPIRGPMQRRGDAPRIKLDLTANEILVREPAEREVHHPYTDRPVDGINISCNSFEEVFAEKIRALAERERPRDLYDVVHLYRHDELTPNREIVFNTLEKKCLFKGITIPTFVALEAQPARAELEAEWENMLGHQLPMLPPLINSGVSCQQFLTGYMVHQRKSLNRSLLLGQISMNHGDPLPWHRPGTPPRPLR